MTVTNKSDTNDFCQLRYLLICDNPQCGKSDTPVQCSHCESCYYCSTSCQATHWSKGHQRECATYAIHRYTAPTTAPTITVERTKENKIPPSSGAATGKHAARNKKKRDKNKPPPTTERVVTCGICLTDDMHQPVLLACGHVFCFLCLDALQYMYTGDQPLPFHRACPYCRPRHMRSDTVADVVSFMDEPCRAEAIVKVGISLEQNEFTNAAQHMYRLALVDLKRIVDHEPRASGSYLLYARVLVQTSPAPLDGVTAVQNCFTQRVQLGVRHVMASHGFHGLVVYEVAAEHLVVAQAHEAAGYLEQARCLYQAALVLLSHNHHFGSPQATDDLAEINMGLSRVSHLLGDHRQAVNSVTDSDLFKDRRRPGMHKLIALPLLALAEEKASKGDRSALRLTGERRNAVSATGYTETLEGAMAAAYHGFVYEDQRDQFNKRANYFLLQRLYKAATASAKK